MYKEWFVNVSNTRQFSYHEEDPQRMRTDVILRLLHRTTDVIKRSDKPTTQYVIVPTHLKTWLHDQLWTVLENTGAHVVLYTADRRQKHRHQIVLMVTQSHDVEYRSIDGKETRPDAEHYVQGIPPDVVYQYGDRMYTWGERVIYRHAGIQTFIYEDAIDPCDKRLFDVQTLRVSGHT